MSSGIDIGDSCEEILQEFEEYVRADGTDQADSGRSATKRDLHLTRDVAESQVLWLYDVSLFDDLQISVRCDHETGAVVEKLVVLD